MLYSLVIKNLMKTPGAVTRPAFFKPLFSDQSTQLDLLASISVALPAESVIILMVLVLLAVIISSVENTVILV